VFVTLATIDVFLVAFNRNFKDMKSGQPLYSPLDQTGSYPHQTVLYPQWSPMPPQQVSVSGQPTGSLHQNPHHHMYGQPTQLRPTLTGFNHAIPPYMSSSHETGTTFVLPLPVQQLQQLQIANGHPGTFCLMNPPHPALFMTAAQATGQPQSHHDS
jgi:hypothetical protein